MLPSSPSVVGPRFPRSTRRSARNARQHPRHGQGRGRRCPRGDHHDHEPRHAREPAARDEYRRVFRSATPAAGQLRGHGHDDGFQDVDADRSRAGGRAATQPGAQDRRRPARGNRHRHRRHAAPRQFVGVLGPELRQPDGRRPADVLEHADHADALRVRREPVHQPEPGVAGFRRWHDAGRGRRRRRRRLQQLFDRRRHQQRQRPPHRGVAQLRHDPGDARRIVEFRCRGRPRHRVADFDDDARRRQPVPGDGQLPGPGRTSSTSSTPVSV